MSAVPSKALPLTPRTHRCSAPIVSVPTHPYHTPPPSQINYSPVATTLSLPFSSKRFAESTLTSSTTGVTIDVLSQGQQSNGEQLDAHTSLREPSARSWLQLDTNNVSRPLPPPRKRSLDKFRRLIIYLPIFIPFPPLLSFLYIVTGHAILQRKFPSPSWSPSILSSAEAGVVGGALLSIPFSLFFALVLRIPPSPPSPTRGADEDFFDDAFLAGPPAHGRGRAGRYAASVCCVGLVLGVGSAAGPLGVTCLGIRGSAILTHAKVAQAGALGSAVCWAAAAVLFTGGFYGYVLWNRFLGAR